MLKLANRVKETSITSGTGSVLLAGGFGAFQTFSSAIGNGNTTFYTIENDTRWEVGIGTYASDTNTLSRDTVLSSSSGGSKIDLNGVSIVFCTLPAEKTVFFGDNNYLPAGKPLTLTRESNGNFIHAFVDNSSDETVALHMQDSSDPTWKFGLKNTPNSTTTAPQYGYVYGANGTAGLYGDSDAYAYIDANLGFYISHEGSNLVQVTKDGGTEIKNGSANVNALSVKGAAAQSSPLQVWTNNTGTTLSSVGSDGSLALGKATGPDYTLDVNGTANVTTVRFSDGSLQTTASKPSGEFGALSGVVETNKSNIATINSTFMPLSSGDVINTLLGAHNYIPDTSGSVINTAISNVISGRMAASSGDVINTALSNVLSGSIPVSSGYIPVNSGDLINTAFSNLASASTGLPTSSGALINTALSNVLAGSIPVSSGYLPISSGAVINSEITKGVTNYALPITSGGVINDAFDAIVNGALHTVGLGLTKSSGGHIYAASGSIVASGAVMLTNDVTSNPTPSGKAVTPQGVINYVDSLTLDEDNMASDSATSLATQQSIKAYVDANAGSVTVGLGLSKVGSNVFGASGSLVTSGVVMLTNDVSSNPTPSGKAVTPQGVIDYVAANPATVTVGLGLSKVGSNVFGASGSIVSSGSVMLTNDVSSNLTPSGKAVTPQGVINYALPTTSGDVINGQIGALVSSAGLGLVNSNGHVYGASGSIVASGAVMLTNHVTSNPTPSGKAVTPQGVINYVDALTLDEDNMASDSATSLATQQSIKAYVDANAGSVTVGLGLSKVGSNVFGASGSLVTSGVVMLTNDVSSNPTPSGKAVTPQGVVNYAMPASSGHDVLHSVGLGLTKSGGHVYAASGSIVASGALMLTNDVSSNPTPSGKAVTPQGVVNYAMPASSGHDVLHSVGLGLTKSGGHVYAASGSIVASGAVMLTNHVTSNPTPSGKAVTPQGVINYAEPIISASNRVPANLIHDGSISNTEFGFLEGIGDNIQGQLNDKVQIAGSGLIKIGTTMHAASGSIVASGALMLTNDVASNPTPSGKAVTPQGVINYVDGLILDEDNLASDSATSLATQQSIKAYVDANAGTVTVGLGLSKVGSNVFGASGSLVTSGVVMLTNDVSSNLTPSGKAVTPQGVINYAMPASSGHDVLHSVGLGLTKSGGHVHAASGSIVASGALMLTNDVASNPTPSGKAVTPQGVINYAAPLTVDMIAGDGLTGGGTIASDRTFTVVGGDGITANANDIAITAAQTTVTSIYNSSLAIGYGASHANINFGTDNQITFDIDGAEQVVLKDGVLHPVTDSDVDLGKFDKTWKDAYLDTIQTTSDIICSGEIRTSGIAYLDNDYAMSIADGGAVTFKKAVHYPVVENTQSSATLALDLATGNHFQVNLGANVTAINLANSTLGQRFIIRFTQDGTGSRTVVWNDVDSPDSSNAYVAWAGGSAPTLTTTPGKSDSLGFICTSGIAYFDGYVIGQGM
jgi:non-canonical (house-cleaning) NTP pyrophosphatase